MKDLHLTFFESIDKGFKFIKNMDSYEKQAADYLTGILKKIKEDIPGLYDTYNKNGLLDLFLGA